MSHKKRKSKKGFAIAIVLLAVSACVIAAIAVKQNIGFVKGTDFYESKLTGELVSRIFGESKDGDMTDIQQYGNIIKVDLIEPGLDTAGLKTGIFSLKSGETLSVKDFGISDFSTGTTENGYYYADVTAGKVEFYDYSSKLINSVQLPKQFSPCMIGVGRDGKSICFYDGVSAKLYIYSSETEKCTPVCEALGYIKYCGEGGGNFFVQSGTDTLISVEQNSGKLKKTVFKGNIEYFSPIGCACRTDDGFDVYNTDGKLLYTVQTDFVDEIPVYVSETSSITVSGGTDGDTLTMYTKGKEGNLKYKHGSGVTGVVPTDNFYAVSSSGTGKPEVYIVKSDLFKKPTEQNSGDSTNDLTESEKVDTVNSGGKIISGVPVISQFPDFPTGCESVSAVIALNFSGEEIDTAEFVSKYLEKSSEFYIQNGRKFGPDPYSTFVGSPRKKNSYGCMAPVIEKAMKKFLNGRKNVVNATGKSLEELCRKYIDNEKPCIVWASIGMIKPYYTSVWTLPDGSEFRWLANEHCLVLVGYDNNYYYFSDPYKGAYVKYEKGLCDERYQAFGQQSIVIA